MEPTERSGTRILPARLLIGLAVLISAEVFSGASLGIGLWNPWTLVVTYWLYFAHFFLMTTLAIRTRRTSLASLYLFGVLFGLFESWITKVIWAGYAGDGKLMIGKIGPYGVAESSMVVLYHPVMSLILPLAVACVLFPELRRTFPEVAWMTGDSRRARWLQGYLVFSMAPVVGMNCGGPRNLALNLGFAALAWALLWSLARPAFRDGGSRAIVEFGRNSLIGLVIYLAALYVFGYTKIRPEMLPSAAVQAATFVWYALAIGGLLLARPRDAERGEIEMPEIRGDRRRVAVVTGLILGLGFVFSLVRGVTVVYLPAVVNLAFWPFLGVGLTGWALWTCGREWWSQPGSRYSTALSTGSKPSL